MFDTVSKSPTEYPIPPSDMVAPTATPPLIVMFTNPFLPVPVTLVRVRLLYVVPPLAGVYPRPGFVIESVAIVPALPTKLPVAPDVS